MESMLGVIARDALCPDAAGSGEALEFSIAQPGLLVHQGQVLLMIDAEAIGWLTTTAAWEIYPHPDMPRPGSSRLGRAGQYGHTTVSGPWEDRSGAKPPSRDSS